MRVMKAALLAGACAGVVSGCTTALMDQQTRLYWRKQQGEMSEADYQAQLRQMREDQPWGGSGGIHEEPKDPLIWKP